MMFGFIKKMFLTAILFFSCNILKTNPLNVNTLECVSVNNQECKIRTKIIDINSN